MKKKFVVTMLMFALVMGMAGCGGNREKATTPGPAPEPAVEETEKQEETEPEPAEEAMPEEEPQEETEMTFTEEARNSLAGLWGTDDLQEVRFQTQEGAVVFRVLVPNADMYLQDIRDVENISFEELAEAPEDMIPQSVEIGFEAGSFMGSFWTATEYCSVGEAGFEVADEFRIEKNDICFICEKMDGPAPEFWMASMSGEYEGSYITFYVSCSSTEGEPLPDYREVMEIVAEGIIPVK